MCPPPFPPFQKELFRPKQSVISYVLWTLKMHLAFWGITQWGKNKRCRYNKHMNRMNNRYLKKMTIQPPCGNQCNIFCADIPLWKTLVPPSSWSWHTQKFWWNIMHFWQFGSWCDGSKCKQTWLILWKMLSTFLNIRMKCLTRSNQIELSWVIS